MCAIIDVVWTVTAFVHAAQAQCGLLHHLCVLLHSLSMLSMHYVRCYWYCVGCCILHVGYYRMLACYSGAKPLHGLSLAKTGNEDIVSYRGYRYFTNIPRTCVSLAIWACVGLRFDTVRACLK